MWPFSESVHTQYMVVLICRLMFDGRIRRRAGDKQYHSDDGYTSDPGIIREEDDDDETDENTETTDGADVSGILSDEYFSSPLLSQCPIFYSIHHQIFNPLEET